MTSDVHFLIEAMSVGMLTICPNIGGARTMETNITILNRQSRFAEIDYVRLVPFAHIPLTVSSFLQPKRFNGAKDHRRGVRDRGVTTILFGCSKIVVCPRSHCKPMYCRGGGRMALEDSEDDKGYCDQRGKGCRHCKKLMMSPS